MTLQILWFVLITVLFAGFFFLEGFDYGVGILLPFLGKRDEERRMIIATIGPFWDGNEVWMITAGGAMFAAFPNWYATLFSGFYMALVLMLVALILRGVAFEFRDKLDDPRWRQVWDWALFFGSAIPALLWGVALVNIIEGVPIDQHMNYVGGFWNLLNPYALLGGLASLSIFTLHGAFFLALKADEPIRERAYQAARRVWIPATVLLFLVVGAGYFASDIFVRLGVNPGYVPLTAGATLLASGWFLRERQMGWAFGMLGSSIVFSTFAAFLGLFPRVMVSSLNSAWSLTITNASSSNYTLTVMTVVAGIMVPIVLIYQAWNYYIFRQRVTRQSAAH